MSKNEDNERFVRAFQAAHGLTEDGWAGTRTFGALQMANAPVAPPASAEPLKPGYLSPNFSLQELTVSAAAARNGVSNVPTGEALATLTETARRMEEVRALLGDRPILVTSGYRSPQVNRLVGGSSSSAHMTGHAVDFTCPAFGSAAKVAAHLARHLTGYDQIIEEFGSWVHVGFGPGQRGQKLTARKVNGRTVYTQGIAG